MNNNTNTTGIITGVLVVLVIIGGALWYQFHYKPSVSDTNIGQVYVSVTDATADIKNVNEIHLDIKKIEVHSAAHGWTALDAGTKTFALLDLKAKNKTQLYATDLLEAGAYDRVRVTTGDAIVNTKTKGNIQAYMPSREITFDMPIQVKAKEDTHIKLDILADKSLHVASGGTYVFATVINAEAQSDAGVHVMNDNSVTLSNTSVDASASTGVDIDGTNKGNFVLDTKGEIIGVDATAAGTVNFILGGNTYTVTESKANTSAGITGGAELGL